MKVLVCGGRNYRSEGFVRDTLKAIHRERGITAVVCGDATGADEFAFRWSHDHGIPCSVYKADWKQHGKAAGPIGNQRMLDAEPDIELVLAFPGGKGTADMVRRATAKGIAVRDFRAEAKEVGEQALRGLLANCEFTMRLLNAGKEKP